MACALALVAGCRDLGLPPGPPGSGSAGPEVNFLIPDVDGTRLSINPDVELSASDVTGVAQVELRCGAPGGGAGGQVQIRVWTAPPYRGTVDLTPCKSLGQAQQDGSLQIALVIHAQDRQGNPSLEDAVREVVIDPDVAVLTTTAPARAAPSAPLTFTVTSDRDLQGAPQVMLGETAATVTGGPRTFTVTFAQTPGIGIDAWDAGTAPPLEVLQDVDHPLVLSIQGRTLSGNLSQHNLSLTLSRLRWSRTIPNGVQRPQPGDTGSWPIAVPSGIQLPLTGSVGWQPGFFSRDDGTYTPFQASALGDAGFTFRGFDGQGNAMANLADRLTGRIDTMFFAPGSSAPMAPVAASTLRSSNDPGFGGVLINLARLSTMLCEPSSQGCASVNEVNCVSASGSTRALLPTGPVDMGAPSDGFGSGDVFLGVNLPPIIGCGTPASVEWELASGGQVMPGPDTFQVPILVDWVLPVGDGSFVVSHDDAGTPEAFLLEANGTKSSVYFSPAGAHAFTPDQLMVARKDRAVAIFRGFADHSEFELYAPKTAGSPGAGLIGQSSIPSRLVVRTVGGGSGSGTIQTLAAGADRVDAVALPDNKVAMAFGVGDPNSYFYVVVVFDANLRPRWMYRIPEPVFSQQPVLVGNGDTIYFVDTFGQILHAFRP
ncbi:MAG TPA: hypothetical protein VIG99_24275 [Myxococcaceae bacterium]